MSICDSSLTFIKVRIRLCYYFIGKNSRRRQCRYACVRSKYIYIYKRTPSGSFFFFFFLGAVFFTSDINQFACEITRQTGIQNQIESIEPVRTSLVQGLLPRLKNSIDILCFNPPYVVTTHEEVGSMGIEAAWAGGIDGREVIDELLPLVKVNKNSIDARWFSQSLF